MVDEARSTGPSNHGRLLLTKLRAPRAASDGVVRERLLREIERGIDGKLTLIVTPPGYGKSTLVSQWQTQSERSSAWVSLDMADNDVLVFLDYVVAAIRSIDASMCLGTASMIHSPAQPPARQLITSLINEVAETTQPFVLVLEDYQVITSAEVQDSVQQLLQLMPDNMSLILTSRKEPNLPTLRMSARGELVELGPIDLSFTPEETREFLIERQQLDLQRIEVDEIERWAEGWPVALRLVAGALRGRSPERVRSLLEALTENVPSVSDYLWDEAIENQPPERRDFLLRTAILRQFNPEVAAEVTMNPAAADLLTSLSRDNLFISRLYGPGSWYRYHHIFADVLRQRLAREVDDEELRGLHARAARWYEANQLTTEAAYHAIQARSWQLAASLLVQICKEFHDQERVGGLQKWLRDLPDEPLSIEPRLAYWLAWTLVRTGHARDAMRPIAIAEAAPTGSNAHEATKAALQLRLLKSLFAWDLEAGERDAAALLESLGPGDTPDRIRALIMLGMLREAGGMLRDSEEVLELARILNGRLGVRGFHVAELSATAILQLSMGKLREPADLFRRITVIGDEWNDLPLQYAQHKLGGIYYEWNRMDEAWTHADRAAELARRMDAPFHLAQVPALRARVRAIRGHWDEAFDEIEQAISASEAAGYAGIVPVYEEMKCRMWLDTDQLTLALGWLQHVEPRLANSTQYQDLSSMLTAIRIKIADGRALETIEALDALKQRATALGWNRALLSIQTLRGIVELEAGNAYGARTAIDDALALGAAEGFVRSFLDEGPQIVPLLRLVAQEPGPRQEYAADLLLAAGEPFTIVSPQSGRDPGILSPRERDVMRLVASGLSNRDVGDALFISEETVKTHMRRIFEKLEVSSRTQAINRAQQLGLL